MRWFTICMAGGIVSRLLGRVPEEPLLLMAMARLISDRVMPSYS
jgi:hypothetical protein